MTDENEIGNLRLAFEELKSINLLIDKICKVRETNHIMSIIINELVKLTEADRGLINLVSSMKKSKLVTIVRDKAGQTDESQFRLNEVVTGWVMKEKRQLKIDDLDSDDRFYEICEDSDEYKILLCAPMIVRGELIGITSLVKAEGAQPFTDDQARLAGIIVSQSAHILSNALLLEELAHNNELLEVSRKQLREENKKLKENRKPVVAFENIIGKSDAMKNVLTLASKVSNNEAPVLITGPTGTGKELIARAIHEHSLRSSKMFVIKNCGVKTETLLESELFGHVKGSFTGADRDKPGLFKQADGGTIFLDEIGDAPASTQVAILRVLESGEIRPIGSTKTEFVDVRIISATNKELRKAIDEKSFREDLFYRLNTFTIDLPSLTKRVDDIPLLVSHFMRKLKLKLGLDELNITPAALKFLSQYHWPGNVRQLDHEIERAALICDAGLIDLADLSPELLESAAAGENYQQYRGHLREIIDKVESEIIEATLMRNKGNILKSSKELGLTRKGLKDKIERLNIILE